MIDASFSSWPMRPLTLSPTTPRHRFFGHFPAKKKKMNAVDHCHIGLSSAMIQVNNGRRCDHEDI